MLLQASQKPSKELQQRQTAQTDSRNRTPRNVSDGLCDLTLAFHSLVFALLAHFGLGLDEATPCAVDSV